MLDRFLDWLDALARANAATVTGLPSPLLSRIGI